MGTVLNKMRAIIFDRHGNTEQLKYAYVPVPKPGPDEVLIKVEACALNHLDLWTLYGMPGVNIPLPHILGCDISGTIAQTGSKVKNIWGQRPVIATPGISCGECSFCKGGWDSLCSDYKILGFQVDGGYAEYAVAPARNILQVSRKLSFEAWAAVPLVYLTAWHMVVTRAQLKKNEKILIHAAGSGVGSAAIQIAKYLGAHVITTVGSQEKVKKAHDLGADEVINYSKKDFSLEVKKITKGKGVDVVVEHIGPETFQQSLACLALKGRLVTCGVTSGPMTQINLRFIFARQLSIIGCYMGGREELKEVVRLIKRKKLRPVVDKVFPLREAPDAIKRMQSRSNMGKIILTP